MDGSPVGAGLLAMAVGQAMQGLLASIASKPAPAKSVFIWKFLGRSKSECGPFLI